jgi:hypothetical protein
MEAENYRSTPISGEGFPGASFVSALEDYTKRIEFSVQEIESQYEKILARTFAVLIFMLLVSVSLPLLQRVSGEMERVAFYFGVLVSLMGIFVLIFFTIYLGLIKLRRLRRNLETLLWPYEKLLQKLSQILDQGNLDEGTSTLMQLKILEAEVAYARARRVISSRLPFPFLFLSNDESLNRDRLDYLMRDRYSDRMNRNKSKSL